MALIRVGAAIKNWRMDQVGKLRSASEAASEKDRGSETAV
jgi:hypothetical protein